jgi:phage tail sheath protein FI
VFKAPANAILRGVLDLTTEIDDHTQDVLNPRGVNAIRKFADRGIRVWGARTLASDALWKYVSVRRLFIFLERSIYEGTRWVVFEPNDDRLWARVIDAIRLFLRTQWRLGALFGRTEEEAFFVTCDRTTMTQDDILNGRLICEIGIAPARPAEFVIFRIFQNTAEAPM